MSDWQTQLSVTEIVVNVNIIIIKKVVKVTE